MCSYFTLPDTPQPIRSGNVRQIIPFCLEPVISLLKSNEISRKVQRENACGGFSLYLPLSSPQKMIYRRFTPPSAPRLPHMLITQPRNQEADMQVRLLNQVGYECVGDGGRKQIGQTSRLRLNSLRKVPN